MQFVFNVVHIFYYVHQFLFVKHLIGRFIMHTSLSEIKFLVSKQRYKVRTAQEDLKRLNEEVRNKELQLSTEIAIKDILEDCLKIAEKDLTEK